MSESTDILLKAILLQLQDLVQLQEASAALIVNAMQSSSHFENCEHCGRLTIRPYQNYEEHSHDFCSERCLEAFIEEREEECEEQIEKLTAEKVEDFYGKNDWENIEDILAGETASCSVKNITVTNVEQTVVPSEEECGWYIMGDGTERRVSYAIDDAYYSCSCECQTCRSKFDMPVHKLLVAKNPCENCRKTTKTRKKKIPL